MKAQINTIQMAILGLIAIFMQSPVASASCGLRANVMSDTMEVSKFIRSNIPQSGMTKVGLLSSPSLKKNKIYQVDANSKDFPEMNMISNEGVATGRNAPNAEMIRNNEQGMGRVIPITRCHSLTNLHVVQGAFAEQGISLDNPNASMMTSYGQANACEGVNAFKVTNHKMKLIGYNKSALYFDPKENRMRPYANKDWAVLASANKLPSAVSPVRIATSALAVGEPALRSGTPGAMLDVQGFAVSGVEYVNASSSDPNGTMTFESTQDGPGSSGGGIYTIGERGLALAAMNVGSGKLLKIQEILRQIKETNPALLADIVRVANGGECAPAL